MSKWQPIKTTPKRGVIYIKESSTGNGRAVSWSRRKQAYVRRDGRVVSGTEWRPLDTMVPASLDETIEQAGSAAQRYADFDIASKAAAREKKSSFLDTPRGKEVLAAAVEKLENPAVARAALISKWDDTYLTPARVAATFEAHIEPAKKPLWPTLLALTMCIVWSAVFLWLHG